MRPGWNPVRPDYNYLNVLTLVPRDYIIRLFLQISTIMANGNWGTELVAPKITFYVPRCLRAAWDLVGPNYVKLE